MYFVCKEYFIKILLFFDFIYIYEYIYIKFVYIIIGIKDIFDLFLYDLKIKMVVMCR